MSLGENQFARLHVTTNCSTIKVNALSERCCVDTKTVNAYIESVENGFCASRRVEIRQLKRKDGSCGHLEIVFVENQGGNSRVSASDFDKNNLRESEGLR